MFTQKWQQKNYNLETTSEGNLSNIALDFNILKSTQFVLEMFRCEISEEISYGKESNTESSSFSKTCT